MTVVVSPAELPAALTLSADALVRGKREDLLDRMEELTHWRINVEGEVNAMRERIEQWNIVPDEDRPEYVWKYRQMNSYLIRAERVASTLNAELARRM